MSTVQPRVKQPFMHDLYLYALEKVSENWLQEANMYRNVCLLGLEGAKPH